MTQLVLQRAELLLTDPLAHEADELCAFRGSLGGKRAHGVVAVGVLRFCLLDGRDNLDPGRWDEQLGVATLNDDPLPETQLAIGRASPASWLRARLRLP